MLALLLMLAAAPAGAENLRNADRSILGDSAAYQLRMTIPRTGKAERVVEMNGFKKGDTPGLARYTLPAKDRARFIELLIALTGAKDVTGGDSRNGAKS